jgi:hypothetical protein
VGICDLSRKLTIDEVKSRLKDINPNIEILSEDYINNLTKMRCKCLVDNYEWDVSWGKLQHGRGCPKCGARLSSEKKRLTIEEINNKIVNINANIKILSEEYIGAHDKLKCECLIDGHIWFATWGSLSMGHGCPMCSNLKRGDTQRLTSNFVKQKLYENRKNIDILECNYVNSKSKIKFKCTMVNCGYIGSSTYSNLMATTKCPRCVGRVVDEKNCIAMLRPDLLIFFKSKEDAYKYSEFSNKKVFLVCPICGCIKNKKISISNLSQHGFSCDFCSDGVSIPEKFVANLLKELKIDFATQYSPKWACGKRYDFYFDNTIIEVHGRQHYENKTKYSMFNKTLQEELENDALKKSMAINNGISNEMYIVIDAFSSEFNYLKSNCFSSLSEIVDLKHVNWNVVWMSSQSSILVDACKHWDNRNKDETITSIGKLFNKSRSTIRAYLKTGHGLGICHYDPKEEVRKNAIKN